MKTKNRCRYNNVKNNEIKRFRLCKNKQYMLNYCYIHFMIKHYKHIIIIQRMYKGYYVRKKLNIYYNLPRDLQRKIIWYINESVYVNNYFNSIKKIIYKRYNKIYYNDNYYRLCMYNYTYPGINHNLYNNFKFELYSLIQLTIKYKNIIDIYAIAYQIRFVLKALRKEMQFITSNSNEYLLIQQFFCLF